MKEQRTAEATQRPQRPEDPLPLEAAQAWFTMLADGPRPLCLDGRPFAGLPNRPLPLGEVRRWLLLRRCPKRTRDAVWAHLVRCAREQGAAWSLACVGMALPALTGVSRWLTARYPGDAYDMQAEVLAGFLEALATVDLDRPRVLVRLRWTAYRRGFAALNEALDAPVPVAPRFCSAPPQRPWGHPDLVLARAVREGVLTRTEADLIGATRLDGQAMADWADSHGTAAQAAYKARQRAEDRLVTFLRGRTRPCKGRTGTGAEVGRVRAHARTNSCPPHTSTANFRELVSKNSAKRGLS
ncbi:hypothetical protein ACFY1L_42715 [Streptomyces sp. NPDC001663]|uniref:hypothetical protein n=1 Tax=Streptomyces sp. NPDC001663 TaxID=3364597 RepID=UPI0036C38AA9